MEMSSDTRLEQLHQHYVPPISIIHGLQHIYNLGGGTLFNILSGLSLFWILTFWNWNYFLVIIF